MKTSTTTQKEDERVEGKKCPECHGQKIIKGICTCDMEWRGSSKEDAWDDCQCTPDSRCGYCHGEGVINS